MNKITSLTLIFSIAASIAFSQQIISTVAGNGTYGFSGDGGPATAAEFTDLTSIFFDTLGVCYINDASNNRIRTINTNGIVNSFAGNGIVGYSGDGGPATAAELNQSYQVTMGPSGYVYIADAFNCRIRYVSPSGIISTIAGTGVYGYSGDGGPAYAAQITYSLGVIFDHSGNYYITDTYSHRVRKVIPAGTITTIAGTGSNSFGGDGGPATAADLNFPYASAVDNNNNIYISDQVNNRIRVVNTAGIISTFAGNGTAGYSGDGGPASAAEISTPQEISISGGDLFIADQNNSVIRKVDLSTGIISTFAGNGTYGFSGDGGPATAAALNSPAGIGADSHGNIFIGDSYNYRVRKVPSCQAGFDLTTCLSACVDTPSARTASIQACIYNNRCTTTNGTLKLVIDTAFHMTSIIADTAAIVSGDTLIWNYKNIAYSGPNHCVSLSGTLDSLPANDSVFITEIVSPIIGDSVPANNTKTYWMKTYPATCAGYPFDPNNKSVAPQGNITPIQKLTYTIHFQNTGTAPAHNVIVIDTLSPYVDPTTLTVLTSSNYMTVQMTNGNIAKFTFDNINLPDTAMSKTSSIGSFTYSIMPLNTDVPGNKIYNGAGIYFDANPVVKTNKTLNTISGPLSDEGITQLIPHMACFPNPFASYTSIVFNTSGLHYLELDDVTGRKIRNMLCSGKQYEMSREGLSSGVYFLKASDEKQKAISTIKIVVF